MRVETRFRDGVRTGREQRGWSQAEFAKRLQAHGCPHIIASMVAKIEGGSRAVRIDEAAVIADLLGTSVDAMLGRPGGGADLMWALSKLSSNAHKMINEVSSLQQRLVADSQDVHDYAARSGKESEVHSTINAIVKAHQALDNAKQSIIRLAGEFPLPGRG